jgi:hypothetical protein
MQALRLLTWQMRNDGQTDESAGNGTATAEVNGAVSPALPSVSDVSIRDLSTWVAGRTFDRAEDKNPSRFSTWVPQCCHSDSKQGPNGLNGDADVILQKLQELLASSFLLEGMISYKQLGPHLLKFPARRYDIIQATGASPPQVSC